MKPTKYEDEIWEQFVLTIVTNFKQWCKDNGTNLYHELNTNGTPGRVTRQTIYQIMNGKKKYLPNGGLTYLASNTNLPLAQLASYKTVTSIPAE